jgi:hypothetical protein
MLGDPLCGWACLALLGTVMLCWPFVWVPEWTDRSMPVALTLILIGVGIIALTCVAVTLPGMGGVSYEM